MFKIVILFGILALAASVPAPPVPVPVNGRHYGHEEAKETMEPIAIVRSEEHKQNDGSYTFVYEGADGTYRQETGRVINPNTDEQDIEITGSYRYIDSDGQLVEVTYTADKNGFLPIGSNIPIEISTAAKAAAEASIARQLKATTDNKQ